jgi:hypothetical protein
VRCLKTPVTQRAEATVTRRSVVEYVAAQRDRYARANRPGIGRLLDEIVAVTSYHGKAMLRLQRRVVLLPGQQRPELRPAVQTVHRRRAALGAASGLPLRAQR